MVYKSLNGLVPEYLSSKFVKRNETRYSLRDSVSKLFHLNFLVGRPEITLSIVRTNTDYK